VPLQVTTGVLEGPENPDKKIRVDTGRIKDLGGGGRGRLGEE